MRMQRIWNTVSFALVLALIGLSQTVQRAGAGEVTTPLRGSGQRPVLPNEQTYGTDNFLIHFTTTGGSAVPQADANGDGTPDYVERVAEALEYTWDVEIRQMGWAPPPPDGGAGGDDRLDVYLEEVMANGFAGYADSEGGFVGDNPLTPERERRSSSSYLALDDDYAELNSAATDETPDELMQATVAHEFNHVVQSGYDAFDPHLWLYEATATWMEDQVYDEVNDGVFYLRDVFDQPDTCLVAEQGWYANWLLLRLLSERYGPEIIRQIWEHSRELDGFASIDLALKPHGSSLVQESRDYGIAMLLRSYEEGYLYPPIFIEGTAPVGSFTPSSGVESLGVDFIRLTGPGTVTVALNSSSPALSLRAVGIRGPDADVIDNDATSLSVDLSGYEQAFALVHNADQTNDEETCSAASYSITVTEGGTPTAVRSTWPAEYFGETVEAPPGAEEEGPGAVQPITGVPYSGGAEDASDSPTGLDVSFETLIPATVPAGYVFDYAYIMTEDDFGTNADFYIPGGGEAANFDYMDQENNWLSIAESPSPYGTVDEWLTDIDYDSPGEIIDVRGTEVLIEDLSDDDGIWYSATLILDGLFIVVDGDHTEEDVLTLVAGLVEAVGSAPSGEELTAPTDVPTVEPSAAPNVAPTQPAPTGVPPAADGLDGATTGFVAGFGLLVCGGGLCLIGLLVVLSMVIVLRLRRQ